MRRSLQQNAHSVPLVRFQLTPTSKTNSGPTSGHGRLLGCIIFRLLICVQKSNVLEEVVKVTAADKLLTSHTNTRADCADKIKQRTSFNYRRSAQIQLTFLS